MTFLRLLIVLLPWPLKRRILQRCFGYRLAPDAWIGLAWIFPRHLEMGPGARIDHLNVAIHLDRVILGREVILARGNWITGYPKGGRPHFAHLPDRDPSLLIGDHVGITKHHHFDCTERITIGAFTTIAGYHSQFLTHSIDLAESRQHARPITIGERCFVGTRCTVLGGAHLPDRSVLGAASLLNRAFTQPFTLYAGSPAVPRKPLDPAMRYFQRDRGAVD